MQISESVMGTTTVCKAFLHASRAGEATSAPALPRAERPLRALRGWTPRMPLPPRNPHGVGRPAPALAGRPSGSLREGQATSVNGYALRAGFAVRNASGLRPRLNAAHFRWLPGLHCVQDRAPGLRPPPAARALGRPRSRASRARPPVAPPALVGPAGAGRSSGGAGRLARAPDAPPGACGLRPLACARLRIGSPHPRAPAVASLPLQARTVEVRRSRLRHGVRTAEGGRPVSPAGHMPPC